jgi:hypothetical protein
MTLYVGEQLRIIATGTEYGTTVPLTDTNVTAVTVTILDRDQTVLIDEAPMTWNPDEALWMYKWDTEGLTSGSYRYRVTVTGADGEPSIEWGRARLARQPTIAI